MKSSFLTCIYFQKPSCISFILDFGYCTDRENCRDTIGSEVDNIFDRSGINMRTEEMVNEEFYQSPVRHDGVSSFASEGNDLVTSTR